MNNKTVPMTKTSIHLSNERKQQLREMMAHYEADSRQEIIDRIIEEAYENYILHLAEERIKDEQRICISPEE